MPDVADAAAPASDSPPGAVPTGRPPRLRGVAGSIWMLEHAQELLTVVVGVMLVLLAAALIVSGADSFLHAAAAGSIGSAATGALDRILLVLILVEIVHTVVLSLRAHQLAAQPFIVVGLVAVIRRILLVLSNEVKVSNVELALLVAMVVAFVAGLIAVRHIERKVE